MQDKPKAKVFGIGFHKTGTKSLAAALQVLGYRVTGPDWIRRPDIAEVYRELCVRRSRRLDAFQDSPWQLVYREMAGLWPDAKFVLTTRDADRWIASVCHHFGTVQTPMRELIYGQGRGSPVGNEAHYLRVRDRHDSDVKAFFAATPDRLLVMDIEAGDGYDALCPFLGHPLPDDAFPHRNPRQVRLRPKGIRG